MLLLLRCAILGLIPLLAACSLPRGAALQGEILAGTDAEAAADFGVEQVTRAALDRLAGWPAVGETGQHWINRQVQPANRIIAPGDTVNLTIWSTEENGLLTGPGQRQVALEPMMVSPDGSIFVPYIGRIRIGGMSPEHAREAVETELVAVTPSAQVQLGLVEGRQSTVSLVGGVSAPGSYPLPNRNYSIMELIADAGGVPVAFQNPQVRLIRSDTIYRVGLDRLYDDPGLDARLVGGDRVFVEEDSRYFLSLGAAGSEAMHPFTRDRLSALEAMSIIGGVNDARANVQGILVLRQYPASALRTDGTGPSHERMVFALDLTSADGLFSAGQFQIRSGDLVYVTESPLNAAQSVFGLVGALFGVARQIDSQ